MQSEGEMCIFYDGLLAGEASLNPPPRRGRACYAVCESKEVAQGSSLGDTSKNNQSWDVSQQPSTERRRYSGSLMCGKRSGGPGKETVRKV